jgi:hypothetical protein
MNKTEQRFLTLVRSNKMRSFIAAHRFLDEIRTETLFSAASELVSRARYLLITDTEEKADDANQFAAQIISVLRLRNQNITILSAKLDENLKMF